MLKHNHKQTRRSRGVCTRTKKSMYYFDDARRIARAKRQRENTNHAEYYCRTCSSFHIGSSLGGRRV